MLSVIMLNVATLSVVMLRVMAPTGHMYYVKHHIQAIWKRPLLLFRGRCYKTFLLLLLFPFCNRLACFSPRATPILVWYLWVRHERDSRQSQSRSGEISKISRHWFAGFHLKNPFMSVHSSGPAIFWTRRYDTLPVRKIWLFWAEQGTAKWPKMPSKEWQCSDWVRSGKKFCSSTV